MKNLYPIVVIALYLATPNITFSQERDWADRVSNGFRSSAKLNYADPGNQVTQLKNNDSDIHPEVKKIIDKQLGKIATRALLVAKGDRIHYEYYSSRNSSRWTPLGYSMSKSLTALTVGKAICDGFIESIDDPLGKYVKELSGTSWGNASVKNVLSMSSGSYKTDIRLNGHKNKDIENRLGKPLYDGDMKEDFSEMMKQLDEKKISPGLEFYYNNMDTIALGLLVESSTGKKFNDYFSEAIWKSSGAESKGAWIVNNLGQVSTYQGFSATPHDWIRLGLFVLENREKDDCFGKFLVEGTQKILGTKMFYNGSNYGYQIWVNCRQEVDFCFLGYRRQYLWFNLKKKTVMYHHAVEDLDEGALISAYLNIVDNIK
jgi:CubicO group peptidase (beta-lactamase class C family)